MRYQIEVADGCHDQPFSPIISSHRSLQVALNKARKSDRLQCYDTADKETWKIPPQNDKALGAGRYGNGITLGQAREIGWPVKEDA